MPELCSAVLLNWQRPYNLPRIVESLRRLEFVGEILVWDNSGSCPDIDSARILRSERNVCTYGRLLAAQQARHDVVLTQDDDCCVRNAPALYERFLSHRTHVVAGLSLGHYRAEAGKTPWLQLGWLSFHLREWFGAGEDHGVVQPYIDRWGEDEVLHRKFDRIYTTLHGLHDPVPGDFEALKGPDGRPSERDRNSLWLRPDHQKLTRVAVARALEIRSDCRAAQAVV